MQATIGAFSSPHGTETDPRLYDEEAERKVLGAMMRSPEAARTALSLLWRQDFYQPVHSILFQELKKCVESEKPYDLVILADRLRQENELDAVGGEMALVSLASCVCTTVMIEHHCNLVKEKARRRMLIQIGQEMSTWVLEAETIDQAFDVTQRAIQTFARHHTRNDFRSGLISSERLQEWDTPPREEVIAPFLSKASLNMIYGPRGIGKSFLTLEMALCIASGSPLLQFQVPKPRTVLYVDGEMPVAMQKERLRQMARGRNGRRLIFYSMEQLHSQTTQSMVLNAAEGQNQLELLLAQMDPAPEVLILDNLSSLCRGDENDNGAQDRFLHWLIRLRHKGLTVLLVHHAGKSGDQRGASRREDPLDTVIKLRKPDGAASQGCSFVWEFTKKRNFLFSDTLHCALTSTPDGWLTFHSQTGQIHKENLLFTEALEAIADQGIRDTRSLAQVLNIHLRKAQRLVKDLREKEWLDDWSITPQGSEFLSASEEKEG